MQDPLAALTSEGDEWDLKARYPVEPLTRAISDREHQNPQ